MYILI